MTGFTKHAFMAISADVGRLRSDFQLHKVTARKGRVHHQLNHCKRHAPLNPHGRPWPHPHGSTQSCQVLKRKTAEGININSKRYTPKCR